MPLQSGVNGGHLSPASAALGWASMPSCCLAASRPGNAEAGCHRGSSSTLEHRRMWCLAALVVHGS